MGEHLIAEVREFVGENETTQIRVCEVTDAAGGQVELRVPLSDDLDRQVYVRFDLPDLVWAAVTFLAGKATGMKV